MNLIAAMNKVLADSYALYLKTQNYHWNVESKHAFHSLHKLFEEQYEELAVAIDTIAEKIRSLDSKAPATFKAYAKLTTLSDGDESADADGMIRDLMDDQTKIIDQLNKAIKIASEQDDEGTADLLIERIRVHDKNRWMLRCSL